MPYMDPRTYKESAERLLRLGDRLLTIKESKRYSDQDARGVALTNCRHACFGAVMVLNILVMGEEGRISGEDFKKLVGMTSGTAQQASEILEKMQRLGFLVIFQFQIENLLANLLRETNGVARPKGYFNVVEQMVSSLPDSKRKLDILNTPALIRNSLHSNGIHHGYKEQSFEIVIDGYAFRFKHLEKVNCAGWGHIVLACNEAISVVEEILNVSAVKSLADPIMDHYAWEEATKPGNVSG